ncbi:MAG TPA: orotate phosphoribosyltransferase-like protein [Halobacteria archaeon]|jgi:orotate phosphoribosyltransferase|nr:orotate phosphoribosyltransferase-like protein [Halobacteria archaeon]
MKGIDELIKKALNLREKGLNTAEIAEDLNVSLETATWLLTRPKLSDETKPRDIYINWSNIGKSSVRMRLVTDMLADLAIESVDIHEIDVVLGIAINGIPLGALVADALGKKFGIIHPKQQIIEDNESRSFLSSNFSDVDGKRCIVVDDIITTGRTAKETLNHLKSIGADVLLMAVIIDKRGISSIDGTPIKSLIHVETI